MTTKIPMVINNVFVEAVPKCQGVSVSKVVPQWKKVRRKEKRKREGEREMGKL